MATVIIIGGGAAGCESASQLAKAGINVELIEKESVIGGNLNNWYQLFPDRKPASQVLDTLKEHINKNNINLHNNCCAESITRDDSGTFSVTLSDHAVLKGDAIVIATGFRTFDAHRKEEYGYGIYDKVITSVELENYFTNRNLPLGEAPQRIGIIHCVGSRDEKICNYHCSKVCCITAVKQAIELRELLPNTEIFCFYMDMRMFGNGYEELYRSAQEKYNIKFVRGRLSETSEMIDKRLQIKVEDTLVGKPMKMSLDMLVLMVGMEASDESKKVARQLQLNLAPNGFIQNQDPHLAVNISNREGVFLAGTCMGPASLTDTLADARSAADAVFDWLSSKK